ncbi:MAG: Ldh family oxidoreductase [Bacteroidales bacterium]
MYSAEYLRDFTSRLFRKLGCSESDAYTIAEILVAAEKRGISSHGMIRIKNYFLMYEKGKINIRPEIKKERETPGTAVVNGDGAYGMVAAKRSMQIAMEKAKNASTGWVATKNSNHFGIAGFYSMMALEEDMIGIAMTNANPFVAPTYSKSRLLGTNPVAVAIPAGKYPPYVADFATTPIARGKLTIKATQGESVEEGLVQDAEGRPSTDPDVIKKGGAILPLGSDRAHGSHKGYCLNSIVDIFSAVLSGANFGPFVPPQVPFLAPPETQVGLGLGHFFGAMRIDAFQEKEEFKNRMDKWMETFRKAENIGGQPEVMIPGDPERRMEEKTAREGIELLDSVKKNLRELADKMGIDFEVT